MTIYDTLKRYFLSGVLVVVPVILTYIVLKFLFVTIDEILKPLLSQLLGYYRQGLGVVTTLMLILLAGVLTRNFLGRRLYKIGDRVLEKIPVTRPIYSAAKQLLQAITSSTSQVFKEVGLIEYPRKGLYALCFVARKVYVTTEKGIEERVSVLVPSTPTPISGTVILVSPNEITILEMTMEEGIKFLVSGGVVSPENLKAKILNDSRDQEISNEAR